MSARQRKAPTTRGVERPAKLSAASGRERLFYAIAALLSLFGLADAVYLTIKHLTGETARCTVTSGCNEVLGSAYSSVGGVPVAALGALAYFTVFSLVTLAFFGYRQARMLLALVVALMLLATLWLLFVQAFILHKYCEYCLFSAALTLILSGLVVALRYKSRAEG
ncbi:MAG TPA: vitamin K epoxide reductase family protein [Pyrinomonadaceae bacterium]